MYGIKDTTTQLIVLMSLSWCELEIQWQEHYGDGFVIVTLNPEAYEDMVVIEYDRIKSVIIPKDEVDTVKRGLEDIGAEIDGMWHIHPDKHYHVYDEIGRYITTTSYGEELMAKAMADTTDWSLSEAS